MYGNARQFREDGRNMTATTCSTCRYAVRAIDGDALACAVREVISGGKRRLKIVEAGHSCTLWAEKRAASPWENCT